jgi:hypothetical protein
MIEKMLQEYLVVPLSKKLGGRLRSVLLFGSAVAYLEEPDPPLLADWNVLVVVDRVDLGVTEAIRPWLRNRDLEVVALTLLEAGELGEMARVFPVELKEIRGARKVLFGEDPFRFSHVPEQNLEHQVRFEVLSKRQFLRSLLLRRSPSQPEVGAHLLSMAQSFAPLARQLLGSRGVDLASREEILLWLIQHADLSLAGAEAVRDLQGTREDRRRPAAAEKRLILEAFLEAWECLVRLPHRVRTVLRPVLRKRPGRRLRGYSRRGSRRR